MAFPAKTTLNVTWP